MKILLANLPWKKGRYWGVRAGSRWPHIKTPEEQGYLPYPFFMAYAAALLKREGFEVTLIDAVAEEMPVEQFVQRVTAGGWDLFVAETSPPSLENDLGILRKLPAALPVALCGPEMNIRTPLFLEKNPLIHFVLQGEYEMTLLELARRMSAKKDGEGVLGLIWRDHGNVRVNPPRPLLEDLDELPWPMRDGLPMHKYNDTPGGIPAPSVQMWSSRGCPYQCSFCVWPQLMYGNRRYRVRGIIDVVDEMEYLVREAGFRSIYFDDDTANIGKLRMMEFSREIVRRKLNIPWAMMARADIMDEDILLSLRAAGLEAIKYGVESADQRLLDNIHKGMDLGKAEKMIRFTKSLGIKTHLTFSFGLPGETRETIKKTIALALSLDPDSLQFSINTAFPGTSYFEELLRKGFIVSRDLKDYDGNARAMLRTEALGPADLRKAKSQADRSWKEHVWRTRPNRISSFQGYAQKFQDHIKHHGSYVAMTKSLVCARVRWMSFIDDIRLRVGVLGNAPSLRLKTSREYWEVTFQKSKKNLLNIMGIYHGSHAFKGPDCVQIDLTSKCNNNCVSCWCNSPLLLERQYRGAKRHKTIPTLLALSLIDELAGIGTRELFFSGGGEPFMHPDIMLILEHAKQRGMHCCVNTNFTLVNEAVIKRAIDMGLDEMTVSIWAATPETYVLTHPNKDEATFYRLKSTLSMLNSLKGVRGPRIKIYNVISNLNFMEVEQMVDLAEETCSECVEFTVVDTIPGATDSLVLDRSQREAVLQQCRRIQKKNKKVQLGNLEHFMRRLSDAGAEHAQYDSGFLADSPCYVGWVFSRIMSNGDVNFCLKAHRMPVGNLYQHSFQEIWNSHKQREFRRKALHFNKEDGFFNLIGNDENCKMGCYKSCDDIGRNMIVKGHIEALSPLKKNILRIISKTVKQ